MFDSIRFFLLTVFTILLCLGFIEYLYDKYYFSKVNTFFRKDETVRTSLLAWIFHTLEREIIIHIYVPLLIAIKGAIIKVDEDRFWVFTRSKRKLKKAFFALKRKKYLKDSSIEVFLYKKGNYEWNADLFACRSKTHSFPMPILYL